MLKFTVGPNTNASFPDTPFLYDHMRSYVEFFSPCLSPPIHCAPVKVKCSVKLVIW